MLQEKNPDKNKKSSSISGQSSPDDLNDIDKAGIEQDKQEKTKIPQELNFIDHHFPYKFGLNSYNIPWKTRPHQTPIKFEEFEKIQIAINDLYEQKEKLTGDKNSISHKLAKKENDYNDLKSVSDKNLRDLLEKEKKLNELTKNKNNLDLQLKDLTQGYTELKNRHHSLEENYNKDRKNWQKETNSLLKEKDELTKNKQKIDSELETIKNKFDIIKVDLDTSKNNLEEEKNKKDKLYSICQDIQKQLDEKNRDYETLREELQKKDNDYREFSISSKSQNEILYKENESLKNQIHSLTREIENSRILIDQGQRSLNEYLRKEEKRRDKEIQDIFTNKNEYIQILKQEKIELENNNEKLKQQIHGVEEEKNELVNLITSLKNEIMEISEQKKQKDNGIQSNNKTKTEEYMQTTLDKEQEYLPYLYQTIRKAKIPCSVRPKSLIEALEMIQKHFEEDN